MAKKDENKIDYKRLEKLNAKLTISSNADKSRVAGWIGKGVDYDEIMQSSHDSADDIKGLQPGIGLGHEIKAKKPVNVTLASASKALSVLERAVKKRNVRETMDTKEDAVSDEEDETEEMKFKVSKKVKSASVLDNYREGKKKRK